MASETLRPDGEGDEENITYVTKPHYERLNDEDDATYIYEFGTTYKRDLYTCEDSSGEGAINSVTFWMRFRGSGGAYTAYIKNAIKISSTVYDGSEHSLFQSATWTDVSDEYTTSPATSDPWTWDEIDGMQIGLSLNASTGSDVSVCSEIWIIIDYTPPSGRSHAFVIG